MSCDRNHKVYYCSENENAEYSKTLIVHITRDFIDSVNEYL